ncbi:hypothetical protein HMY34_00400 [Thiothrix subterranea]|uniref:hypothetical protein n=1 Tax=Thiothrix subterranea TaxID=2735563 RepID=UPI00192ABF90|nr:hypothetical protein [Thiothrix subterranea]QQZ27337.1 hypothetical protein HMY34_00400 [Thiothrix subterranea]
MDEQFVARIYVWNHKYELFVGTGYPLQTGVLLTALHVVSIENQNIEKGILVQWPYCDQPDETLTPDAVHACASEHDIALLHCLTPLADARFYPRLAQRFPKPDDAYQCRGFPLAGQDDKGHVAISASGRVNGGCEADQLELLATTPIKVEGDWAGLSGAPVFINGCLSAVITIKYKTIDRYLYAVSIPYLLEHITTFREAVGYAESNRTQQFFLDECGIYLDSINDSPLFLALITGFVEKGLQPSAAILLNGIQTAVENDPVAVIEKLRLLAEPVMTKDHASAEHAKTLLCLLLGVITAKNPANDQNIHNLAVYSRMMVEVSLATHYKVRPDLKRVPGKNDVVGCYVIDDECLREVGWKTEDNTKEIIKVVNVAVNKAYKRVHGSEPKETLGRFDLRALNTTLLTRRKNKHPELIRFEIETTDMLKKTHPLHDEAVCAALHHPTCLPNLPIVRYGLEAADKDADLEADLYAQVNEFFRIIQQYS